MWAAALKLGAVPLQEPRKAYTDQESCFLWPWHV